MVEGTVNKVQGDRWMPSPVLPEDPAEQLSQLKTYIRTFMVLEMGIRFWDIRNFSIYDRSTVERAIFEIIAEFMRVDAPYCKQAGVELIISRPQSIWRVDEQDDEALSVSCFGLANMEKLRQATTSVRGAGNDQHNNGATLTVALQTDRNQPFYEVAHVPEGSEPAYAVVGVWAPMKRDTVVPNIGAILTDKEANAYIV